MGLAFPEFTCNDRGSLWDWTGRDAGGHLFRYQTNDPSYAGTREQMMATLRKGYPNLEIVELSPATIHKPAIGSVDYHAFSHGIVDEVIRELAQARMRSRVLFGSLYDEPPPPVQSIRPASVVGRLPSILRTAQSILKGAV